MQDEHPKNPVEASREGLEQLERVPHHATTERDKPAAPRAPEPTDPPGERARGGPVPDLKR